LFFESAKFILVEIVLKAEQLGEETKRTKYTGAVYRWNTENTQNKQRNSKHYNPNTTHIQH